MTTRILRFLAVLAIGFLALRAFAHEVDCEKTVGALQLDASGNPVLDPDLMPIFVTTPATTLVIDQYPAVIGWRLRVNNLANATSFIERFVDPILDENRYEQAFGWIPHFAHGVRQIPAGESTDAVLTQRIRSYEECVGLSPPASIASIIPPNGVPPDGQMCRNGRVNVLTVVTESNIAQCRAKVICKPPPSRLPPTCETVAGINWCYDPQRCGTGCEAVCSSLGLTLSISDADWFAAQDTSAECAAIGSAFGVGATLLGGGLTCLEDEWGDHTSGQLLKRVLCSTAPTCPSAHRLHIDQSGVPCGPGSRLAICPCDVVPP